MIIKFCPTVAALIAFVVYSTLAIAASAPPPGYSSRIVHVKFRQDTPVESPELLLPPELRNSMASITQLFSRIPRQKLDNMKDTGQRRTGRRLPDLSLWFKITLKPGVDSADFVEKLRRLSDVETAQFAPLPAPPPATTPNFTTNQGYLDAAPEGIAARYSWTIPGGNGAGLKIYDVEYKAWNQDHEDLSVAQGIPILVDDGDSGVDPFGDDHGTGVLGILIANHDSEGVTGVSWGAGIGLAPAATVLLGYNPAHAIALIAGDGSPGDVILIEQQISVCGLANFGPVEWDAAIFDVIQTAVANGFVVVEAAGNGNANLDQAACGSAFDRSERDSGAIIVGAGKPPGSGADRQRESFSTYGSRVDLQGWGSNVMTTGNGSFYRDPDDPTDPDFWYTASFGGTSSASAIVAGAAANLQGVALDRFGVPLTSSEIRALLVETGSPQLGNTSEPIGPRPNLRGAISQLLGVISVDIDIKPRGFVNNLNVRSKGLVSVAILTTNMFDAAAVDATTVRFGKNGTEAPPVRFALEDINRDGHRDLLLYFNPQDTDIQCGDTSALVTGQTLSGRTIEGFDSVRVTGCGVN